MKELRVKDAIEFTNKKNDFSKYCEFKIYNQLSVLPKNLDLLILLVLTNLH